MYARFCLFPSHGLYSSQGPATSASLWKMGIFPPFGFILLLFFLRVLGEGRVGHMSRPLQGKYGDGEAEAGSEATWQLRDSCCNVGLCTCAPQTSQHPTALSQEAAAVAPWPLEQEDASAMHRDFVRFGAVLRMLMVGHGMRLLMKCFFLRVLGEGRVGHAV